MTGESKPPHTPKNVSPVAAQNKNPYSNAEDSKDLFECLNPVNAE